MRSIKVSATQFEVRDGNKDYNLSRIRSLTADAVQAGSELVSFHEVCIPGYTFVENLSRPELLDLAEPVPDGPSVEALIGIAGEFDVALGAGLLEVRRDGNIYNTYVVVTPEGLVAAHSKLHPFVSEHLMAGNHYTVFELLGCTFGVLICYDCNLIENVRITAMMGAEIVLMPHVTGCLPSPMPGRGWVEREVWENREQDPVTCRMEFDGPKGRGWLMHWLPTRAYENGIYAVFSNPIGVDGDTIKPGNAMIIDPYGEILIESHKLGDEAVTALLVPEKIEHAPGRRYIRARRPELYAKLVEPVSENEKAKASSRFADVYWKKHRT